MFLPVPITGHSCLVYSVLWGVAGPSHMQKRQWDTTSTTGSEGLLPSCCPLSRPHLLIAVLGDTHILRHDVTRIVSTGQQLTRADPANKLVITPEWVLPSQMGPQALPAP